jgi:hypothetical protein
VGVVMQNRFTKLVDEKSYIDKSHYIKTIVDDKALIKNFIVPRGFGKSINLDMLNSYFSNQLNHSNYFKELEISKTDAYLKQGQYPVIYINLSSLCCNSYAQFKELFNDLIIKLYQQFQGVLLSKCDDYEINEILTGKANDIGYVYAIKNLMSYLECIFEKRVILLIEDYDLLLNQASDYNFAQELTSRLINIFRPVLKDNIHLETAVMMGKEYFPKDTMFSGLNTITTYHFSKSMRYGEFFGFNVDEIAKKINRINIQQELYTDQLIECLRENYGGYYINNIERLNSQSVAVFLNHLTVNNVNFTTDFLDDNAFIRKWLKFYKNKETLLRDLEKLVNNETIEKQIPSYTKYQLENEEDCMFFWGRMINLGYLTYTKVNEESYNITVELNVPNLAAKQFYSSIQECLIKLVSPKYSSVLLDNSDIHNKSQSLLSHITSSNKGENSEERIKLLPNGDNPFILFHQKKHTEPVSQAPEEYKQTNEKCCLIL